MLAVLVEVDDLEHQGLTLLGGSTVFLGQMLGSSKALNAVGIQTDLAATLGEFADGTLVHAATGKDGLVGLPRILLELLVTEAQTTILLVDVENDNVDGSVNLGKLARVFNLLGPGQVTDVDQTLNALFHLNKDTEVGEVAHLGGVLAANGVLLLDGVPRIVGELLNTKRHLAVLAVQSQDNGLDLVAHLHEVLCRTQAL